jgi:murein DD-endopeptidase MepM/ murein hydrolase activator NlpD
MKILFIIISLFTQQAYASNQVAHITIKNNFYTDAKNAGISYRTINTIINIFKNNINFSTLRKRDEFIIINAYKKKPDAIIFKRRNKTLSVFLWKNQYYNKNGVNLSERFLKAPLNYKRISSKFQLKRYHPILKTYLPHRAIDYSAKYGTKVYATASGVILKRHNIGALGNAVFIQHENNYQTVYAHLSAFAKRLHTKQRVRKGQLIGYVGSTGRSTGPHLHYEIRHHNKRVNPLSSALFKRNRLPSAQLRFFLKKIKTYASIT